MHGSNFPRFAPTRGYWRKAKWYTREHCDYSFKGLRQTVLKALASVEQKTICGFFNRSMRILEAYRDVIQYGCAEFKNRVYKSHLE